MIDNAVPLADSFRAAGAAVVLVHVATSPDGGDWLRAQVDEPSRCVSCPPTWPRSWPSWGPRRATSWWRSAGGGVLHGTDLDLHLRRRGIIMVVLGGIATTYGVESTARDGYERGYQLVLVEDAMSARSASDHAFAFARIFPRIGRVCQTDDVIAGLGT